MAEDVRVGVVAGGILPDHDGTMRAEVVEDDDEPFVGIRSPILFQYLSDVFLFGVLPEHDDGDVIDGKNGGRTSRFKRVALRTI
jgi:hypothetical protein